MVLGVSKNGKSTVKTKRKSSGSYGICRVYRALADF